MLGTMSCGRRFFLCWRIQGCTCRRGSIVWDIFPAEERGICFRRKKSRALICWVGIVGLGLLDVFKFTSFLGLQNTNNEIVDPVKLRTVIMKRNRVMGINVHFSGESLVTHPNPLHS